MTKTVNVVTSVSLLLLFLACGGGDSAPTGLSSVGPGPGGSGSLSLRLDTSAIPRALLQTDSQPDTLMIDVLNPQELIPIAPRSVFTIDRTQAVQVFTVTGILYVVDRGNAPPTPRTLYQGQPEHRRHPQWDWWDRHL